MLAQTYDEFWKLGIGAYMWTETIVNTKPTLSLLLKVPFVEDGKVIEGKVEVLRLFPRRSKDNWAESGQVKGWDGNKEKPTLTPSIWARNRKGWHGYLTNGKLFRA